MTEKRSNSYESTIRYVYLLGIGGIGMSALARYFNQNLKVFGYDRTETPLTKKLESEGIDIQYHDDLAIIPGEVYRNVAESLVIYTPAIPKSFSALKLLKEKGHRLMKRSEILGIITKDKNCLAIAGTHGKTSTSSILAHILHSTGHGCNAFIGGITANYQSNLILSKSSNTFVVEADEFDRSFLALHPKMAVITSMDADHLDIYGEKEALENSFQDFANQIDQNGLLLIHKSIVENIEFGGLTRSYSADDVEADIHAENMHIKDGAYHFDIRYPKGKIADITFHFPGKHNVENACAAVGIALEQGVSEEEIRTALLSFKGVVRRFQTHVSGKNRIYIDDYAHHPAELTATINSARALYPNKRLCGIFQPHLFSRTQDFADEFALALDLLDEIILLPIYPAREEPIPGVDSQLILDKMKSESKKTVQKNELLYELKQVEAEVILTLGAGDIDQFVEPIAKALNK